MALHLINPEDYRVHVKRLGDHRRRELDDVVLHKRRLSRFDLVLFFQTLSIFENIPGIILSYVSDISVERRMKAGETVVLDERSNAGSACCCRLRP